MDHDVVKDPYFRRERVLFSFNSTDDTRALEFNLSGDLSIGTLLFFSEDDIVRTSRELFATYPFTIEQYPRTVSVPRADGSTLERIVGKEPRLQITINLVPKGNYKEFSDDLEKFMEIVSPQQPFLYVGENFNWDVFIMGKSLGRRVRHVHSDYNKQRIPALTLEVK